jgi:hypothetical protein
MLGYAVPAVAGCCLSLLSLSMFLCHNVKLVLTNDNKTVIVSLFTFIIQNYKCPFFQQSPMNTYSFVYNVQLVQLKNLP